MTLPPQAENLDDKGISSSGPRDHKDWVAAIQEYRRVAKTPDSWTSIKDVAPYTGLCEAYLALKDIESAIFYANQLARHTHSVDAYLVLAACYRDSLQQYTASVDFLRRASSMDPSNGFARLLLGVSLATAPVPSLRDGVEASVWIEPLSSQAYSDWLVAKATAIIAAENENFELAVESQLRCVALGPSSHQADEQALVELYRQHKKPPFHFPIANATAILSDEELFRRAAKSTVCIRVQAIASDAQENQHATMLKRVDRYHMGAVLNRLGTILISNESIELPHLDDEDVFSPRMASWASPVQIEVFAMGEDEKSMRSIGEATILGRDPQSGIAVLQVQRQDIHEPISGIEPIKFRPEHSSFDPVMNLSPSVFYELNTISEDDSETFRSTYGRFQLVERAGGELARRTHLIYGDSTLPTETVSMFLENDASQAAIGTPLFNRFGEFVGLSHSVANRWSRKAAIPSAVCSRVSSKLCAFGYVPRAFYSLVASSVCDATHQGDQSSSGMWVSKISPEDAIALNPELEKVLDQIVLRVDRKATPTLTEWLIAMERIAAIQEDIDVKMDTINTSFTACQPLIVPSMNLPIEGIDLRFERKNEEDQPILVPPAPVLTPAILCFFR